MGFPGLGIANTNVKLAQQNYGVHYRVLKSLADRYHPDAMFPLMDLSVEANALGRYTVFPVADSATVVKDHFEIAQLTMQRQINISYDTRLQGYVETMKLMNIGLPGDIIKGAYVTGPYSLAGLIMGADEAAMATILEPEKLTELCEFTTEKIQEYVQLLIGADAQVICILEPSAVMLGPDQFEQFSSSYVKHITNLCKYTNVATVYHTCGNTMHLIEKMAESGVDAISLDSPEAGVDLPTVAKRLDDSVVIMGNINPTGSILFSKPEDVERDVKSLLESMAPYPNFIVSTGCDLPQETPLENIEAFIRTARAYRIT
ncbi:uroporphyrinogen decarboxylase family protein [candidate division KSB1 bacterium]|nr:uroporphyrinogen decarboxylase family protein [candidate division KSB1 bacterium]